MPRTAAFRIHREPEVWIPYTVTGSFERGILVRTAKEPLAMLNAVRQEIWATDRSVALTLTGTLEGYISQFSYAGPRFGFFLLGIFASIGLVLVTIGVYSVLAYTAARRTHEIGIRMALGAERGDVLKLVINMGLRLVILGVAIGSGGQLGGCARDRHATLGRLGLRSGHAYRCTTACCLSPAWSRVGYRRAVRRASTRS